MTDITDNDLLELDAERDFLVASLEELTQLDGASHILATVGSSQSSLAIMQAQGLFNGTALGSVGLENFTTEGPDGAESQFALEALTDKIKEKTAAWSARILHMLKVAAEKVFTPLNALWTKVSAKADALSTVAWDKIDVAGKTAKAHPYKTALAVVAAISAVAAIIVYSSSNLPKPDATPDQLKSFSGKVKGMMTNIQWPAGKVEVADNLKVSVSTDFTKIDAYMDKSEVSAWERGHGSLKAILGHTLDHLKAGWKSFLSGTVKMVTSVGTKVYGAPKVLGKHVTAQTGSVGAGVAVDAIGSLTLFSATYALIVHLIANIIVLVINLVVKGMNYINQAFTQLTSGHKTSEAA